MKWALDQKGPNPLYLRAHFKGRMLCKRRPSRVEGKPPPKKKSRPKEEKNYWTRGKIGEVDEDRTL